MLAWYYGQLVLTRAPKKLGDWLRDADSWITWVRYPTGFGYLAVAAVQYALALLAVKYEYVRQNPLRVALSPIVIALTVLAIRHFVLTKYKYEDEPFGCYWKSLRKEAR